MKLIGIALIVVGIIGLGYGAITYTRREKVVDAGPVQISRDAEKSIPISPVVGAIALAVGIAVLVLPRRATTS